MKNFDKTHRMKYRVASVLKVAMRDHALLGLGALWAVDITSTLRSKVTDDPRT